MAFVKKNNKQEKRVILNCDNISQYNWIYCNFPHVNTASVSLRKSYTSQTFLQYVYMIKINTQCKLTDTFCFTFYVAYKMWLLSHWHDNKPNTVMWGHITLLAFMQLVLLCFNENTITLSLWNFIYLMLLFDGFIKNNIFCVWVFNIININ